MNRRVFKLSGTIFRVDRRYKDLVGIGRGSYGVVASATDTSQDRKVAIKKITPMATHVSDAKHVLREIRLMRYLSAHPNIISMYDLFCGDTTDDELYICMELLDSDLHRIIQSPQPLTDGHVRYFMYQLIKGIKYIHSHGIIHRDLKPGNLLVTRNCDLRITDFGLAREHAKQNTSKATAGLVQEAEDVERMTQHVVTRWYRPPELMLCPDGLYSYEVDMWSIGCILAELLGRKPLFPGKNFVHQLTLIFNTIGAPKPSSIQHITNAQATKFLDSMKHKPQISFQSLYPKAGELEISLLENLLKFEPNLRYNAKEAMFHDYFTPFEPSKEPEPDIHPDFNFNFERQNLQRPRLRQLILDEVASFRREVRHEPNPPIGADKSRGLSTNHQTQGGDNRRRSSASTTATMNHQQQQQKSSTLNATGKGLKTTKQTQSRINNGVNSKPVGAGVGTTSSSKVTNRAVKDKVVAEGLTSRAGTAAAAAAWRSKTPSPHSREDNTIPFPPAPGNGVSATEEVISKGEAYGDQWKRKEFVKTKQETEIEKREFLQKKLLLEEEVKLQEIHLKSKKLKEIEEEERRKKREEIEKMMILKEKAIKKRQELEEEAERKTKQELIIQQRKFQIAKEEEARRIEQIRKQKMFQEKLTEELESQRKEEAAAAMMAAAIAEVKCQDDDHDVQDNKQEEDDEARDVFPSHQFSSTKVYNSMKYTGTGREGLVRRYAKEEIEDSSQIKPPRASNVTRGNTVVTKRSDQHVSSSSTSHVSSLYGRTQPSSSRADMYTNSTTSKVAVEGGSYLGAKQVGVSGGVRGGGTQRGGGGGPEKKPPLKSKKLTVPKSPNFSKMSWQREHQPPPAGVTTKVQYKSSARQPTASSTARQHIPKYPPKATARF